MRGKKQKVSGMLEEETKKMEEKLELVKKMVELERSKQGQKKDGGWRSATTQKQISGYSQMVLAQHRQQQPSLPPTSMIMGKENKVQSN